MISLICQSLSASCFLNFDNRKVTPITKKMIRRPVTLTRRASAFFFPYSLLDQMAFSRCPMRAAAAANTRMLEPKYWWKGRSRARMSPENLGKRNARNPRVH